MSTQVQYRRGTATQNNAFVGALAEITVDTTNKTLRVHDGATAGGSNIATVSYVDTQVSATNHIISNGTSQIQIATSGGNANVSIGGVSNVAVFTTSGISVGNVITSTVTATTVGATNLSGTLQTAAQTNVTSVGTLSSLAVTGDITSNGTLNANALTAVSGSATVTAGSGDNSILLVPTGTGTVDVASKKITNLAEPVAGTDAVTKTYVDSVAAQGVFYHQSVRLEQPTPVTVTYNNGTAGVGATLTNAGTQAALVVDGVTANVDDRILIYQQSDARQNGVYTVTNVGSGSTNWVLTRSTDTDSYSVSSPDALGQGDAFYVTSGDTGAGETYICNTEGTITFGTTNITFVQISSAQVYSAGTGIDLTGTVFSVNPNQSLTTVTASGTITAATVNASTIGNAGATITGTTVNAAAIGNSGATLTGTIQTASQTNITGVGTITTGTWAATDVAVAHGGTGASDAGTARTNLGLAIGTNVQAYDSDLAAIATNATNGIYARTGTGTVSARTITASTGISVSNGDGVSGNPTITNTGVTSAAAGTGVSVSGATGAVTFSIGQAIGTGNSPTFAGITIPSITKNGTNGVGDIGQSGNKFATIYATTFSGTSTSAQYADLAELYSADDKYIPGTVLMFGGQKETTQTNVSHSHRIAGIVSTNPAHVMNSAMVADKLAMVALIGRVPCRVIGKISKGDCLVSSDIPGVATVLDPTRYMPGVVIGKALADYNSPQEGLIEVVVGRL